MLERTLLKVTARGDLKIGYLLFVTAFFIALLIASSSSFQGYKTQVEVIQAQPPDLMVVDRPVDGAIPFYTKLINGYIEVYTRYPKLFSKLIGAEIDGEAKVYVGEGLKALFPNASVIRNGGDFIKIVVGEPSNPSEYTIYYIANSSKVGLASSPASYLILNSIYSQIEGLFNVYTLLFLTLIVLLSLIEGFVISHHADHIINTFLSLGASSKRISVAFTFLSFIIGAAITALGFGIGISIPSLISSIISFLFNTPHVKPIFGYHSTILLLLSFLSISASLSIGLVLGYRRRAINGKVNKKTPILIRLFTPKVILALTLVFIIILLTASITFNVTYGAWRVVNQALWQDAIVQTNSRTVFSSRVPLALAISLNHLEGVQARPQIVALAIVKGEQVVARWTELDSLKLVKGSLKLEEPWALIGKDLARRLNLDVGDIIVVGGIPKKGVVLLAISGIYSTEGIMDSELLVPFKVAKRLAGIPEGFISYIDVEAPFNLNELISSYFTLEVRTIDLEGQIAVVDTMDNIVEVKPIRNGKACFELPFGLYKIKYVEKGYSFDIDLLLLNENKTVNFKVPDQKVHLRVLCSNNSEVSLNDRYFGFWENGAWNFEVPAGYYTLKINGTSYPLPLFGNSTFNARKAEVNEVSVRVFWADGSEAKGSLFIVRDEKDNIVLTAQSSKAEAILYLPKGRYALEVYNPPFSAKRFFEVPSDKAVEVTINAVKSMIKLPPTLIKSLGVGFNLSAQAIVGLTLSFLIVILIVTMILPLFAMFSGCKYAVASCSKRIKVMEYLGASKLFLIKTFSIPVLLMSIFGCLTSHIISLSLSSWLEGLTIFGYRIYCPEHLQLLYLFALTLLSFLYFSSRLRSDEGR